MQGLLFSLGLLASSAVGFVAAEDLKIDVTQAVECDRKTVKGDRVSVHYRGSLQADGKEFDASYKRGRPFNLQIGAGMVIDGWEQGLLDMCIGEKRTLTIPPELGYGYRAMGPIPAGSTLIFETELLAIDGVQTQQKIVVKKTENTENTENAENAENAEEASKEKEGEGEGEKAEKKEEEEQEGVAEKVAEKVASVAGEAAEAAKTIVADTDDSQEHNEL